jgi:acetyl esterase/lipase
LLLALAALVGAAQAQVAPAGPAKPAVLPPHVAPPDLGLPALPLLEPGSPRDSMLYADRFEVGPSKLAMSQASNVTTGQLIDFVVPASMTGTTKQEGIQYLVPSGYRPGTAIPLLVVWHGFGSSAAGVSAQTTLDEECEARGWAYLAVTGIDDKLFGPPVAQQNVTAAIAWMESLVTIDPTRVYGVGFSMGAGCISSFAARHRDPAGPVFAGLGLVSGSYDWTQTWWLEPGTRGILENLWNFGAPPNLAPFAYQRVSNLYFTPASYPPQPGTLEPMKSMAQNLGGVPTWITWDTGDSLVYLPAQSAALGSLIAGLGGTASLHPVSGTVNPADGTPATHSWAVLNAHAVCDFLAPLHADLRPAVVHALVDEKRQVSWMTIVPAASLGFASANGEAANNDASFDVHDVAGATHVLVTPLSAAPWTLSGQPGGGESGWSLGITGTAVPAGWAEDSLGAVSPNFEFDPLGDGLLLPVTEAESWVVQAQAWDGALTVDPDPATPGHVVHLKVDAPAGCHLVWLIAGINAAPYAFNSGHVLLVQPVPPFLLLSLPTNAAGDVQVQTIVPNGSSLSGAWMLLQAVLQGQTQVPAGTTNPFRFDVK